MIKAVIKILDLINADGKFAHFLVNNEVKKKKRNTLTMPNKNQIKGRLFENDMIVTRNNKTKYTRIALAVKYSEIYFKL